VASVYSQLYNFASLVAPIAGGALYNWENYGFTMSFNFFLELSIAVLFLIFNCGCNVYAMEKV
jgi:hypothetical protein